MNSLGKIFWTMFFFCTSCISCIYAQIYPPDFAQQLVVNGISNPTSMAFAPDGRIFVAEQSGRLRVIKNNVLLPTSFVQLTVSSSGERGLIGIVLDPDFATNNYIYLYYTVPGSPVHNRISRFTANGDVAQMGSESIVLELDPLSTATNHNGGAMQFGKDGKLYIAIGENANPANAQNLDTYHGKLLRINKDGSVPDGNPFFTGSEQKKRVWAYGLRNPYTFSIHPQSGRILVNDVGQDTWEEVNDATTGGRNFGWPTTEGNFNQATSPGFTNPIYSYQHGLGDGKGCALTGGTFFYPLTTNYPASYVGRYFIQDYCNNWINSLDLGSAAIGSSFATAIQGSSLALSVGNDGNLYFLSRNAQALYKIIYTKATIPHITSHPESVTVAAGQPVSFHVSSLGTTPLTYQWQKDGVDISGATSNAFSINITVPGDRGQYHVIVSNEVGSTSSNAASLSVTENALPMAEIITPLLATTYVAGTDMEFAGRGIDAEDGPLPSSALSWQINFHHDTHKHDQPPIVGISNGIFSIPNEGETSENVWYRIILTVTDSNGLTGKDSVDLLPQKSVIRLISDPPGLQITIDGQPFVTPVETTSVEGILRTIGTITPQMIDNVAYEFNSWSNGEPETHVLVTPFSDIQLTASFSTIVGTEADIETVSDIALYPNPTGKDFVTVTVFSRQNQDVTIHLMDLLSRHVAMLKQNLPPGKHDIPLNFGRLRPGIYSVMIKGRGATAVKKLAIIE